MLTKQPWYPILYMFVVTAIFCTVLIGFGRLTEARVKANEKLALEKAVLFALPLDLPAKATDQQWHALFEEKVKPPSDTTAGAYTLEKDGKTAAYALPFAGKGFWNIIRGVVGIEPDGRTITGIYFYEQSETPGLGAEITKPAWYGQFKGKRFAAQGQPLTMKGPGETTGENSYNAVTGATQTSIRLERIINESYRTWREAMDKAKGS